MAKMSMSEVSFKQMLRKIEYPECAKGALNKIVELICGRVTTLKNMDLSLDLMAEFVFREVDRRGQKRQLPLSPMLELQLLNILYKFFAKMPNELTRNTVFLSLFSATTVVKRLGILGKLVSLAIAIPSANILMSASAWMQQLGNTSPNSRKLAEAVIKDYFHYYPNLTKKLEMLPKLSPQFTANFMTAISENYFNTPIKIGTTKGVQFPPKVLLETIISWISNNSGLMTAAQRKRVTLPVGAIAMEATIPIAGLIKWCVLAPLYDQHDQNYGQLHLAVLTSIEELPKNSPSKVIYAQHLSQLVTTMLNFLSIKSEYPEIKLQNISKESLHLSLERYAQALIAAYSANTLYGHLGDLLHQLKLLPFNRLMDIVTKTIQQNRVLVL